MTNRKSLLTIIVIGILIIVITSCEMNSRGAAIFRNSRCIECHTIKGKGGSAGPDLTTVGKRRSREYIVEQIKNPKAHNANTNMPSFRDLPAQNINDLADYLSRLK